MREIKCENQSGLKQIMKYTGLTDKNNNKIFEGDVVQFFYNGHPKGEIIGNIYDNPDLRG